MGAVFFFTRPKDKTMNDPMDDERIKYTTRAGQLPIDIDRVIAHLADQQTQFSGYIDRGWPDLDVKQLARLLSLYGQNATRLGRLLRDRCISCKPSSRTSPLHCAAGCGP